MDETSVSRWRYAVSGGLTGFVNGFFGAGGGMVLIPLLTRVCKVEDKEAFATSLSVVLPISLTSIAVYALQGNLEAGAAWPYLVGGAAGGLAGGLLFKKVSANFLHKALGAFILWGGIRLVMA